MLALLILCCLGCGTKRKTDPTFPVIGTVTFKGAPLADVNVTFQPEKGRASMGKTDGEGKFTLSTFEPGDGALAGQHRISVSLANVTEPMPGTPEYRAAMKAKKKPPFPNRYRDVTKSGLTARVTADGENNFDLKLEE